MSTVFSPRQVEPSLVRLENALAAREISVDIVLANQPARLSLLPVSTAKDYNIAFKVTVNQIGLTFLADHNVLNAYLANVTPDLTFSDLPHALRQGVCTRFWEEIVSGVATQRGVSLTLQEGAVTQQVLNSQFACCMALALGQEVYYFKMLLRPDLAPWFEQILDQFPARQQTPAPNLPVVVRFEKGRTQITRNELAGVEPFDVILFDTAWQDMLVSISQGRTYRARTQIKESHSALGAELPGSMQSSSRLSNHAAMVGVSVTLEEVVENVENPEMSGDLNSVPVTLTFELDRQQVALGDLMQIAEGYTFSLASNVQAPIQIRANGQLIGSAELVQIGDHKLGARVLTIQNR
jgi:type III secretion system YscQ/HrcQ family protein